MKPLLFIALFCGLMANVIADSPVQISEKKAEAIIRALPEFAELAASYRQKPDDLVVDGPILESADPSAAAKIGKQVWRYDVYLIADAGSQAAHGYPWAFFIINADSGAVFIREPYPSSPSPSAFIYLSLSEWRKKRIPQLVTTDNDPHCHGMCSEPHISSADRV
jgi:hypothetical protein